MKFGYGSASVDAKLLQNARGKYYSERNLSTVATFTYDIFIRKRLLEAAVESPFTGL